MDELDVKINRIKTVTRTDALNPNIINLARQITQGETTNMGKVNALYNWVKRNVKYRRERKKLDIFVRPITMLQTMNRRGFDCEDHTGLMGALALSLGLPVKFKVIKRNGTWSHIYPIIANIPADTTVPISLGQEVRYTDKRIYKL